MSNFFQCTVKYNKLQDDGQYKNVAELYMTDACSYGDAEDKIYEEVSPFMGKESQFMITGVKPYKCEDLLRGNNVNADYFFKADIVFEITSKGKTKKKKKTFLIHAANADEVIKIVKKNAEVSGEDMRVTKIEETKINDIFLQSSTETKVNA